jgi:hypothetical protein
LQLKGLHSRSGENSCERDHDDERGCWLLVEEVEKIPSKVMMMMMKGLLLLEEKPRCSQ